MCFVCRGTKCIEQTCVCWGKTFVMTKMILVASPANATPALVEKLVWQAALALGSNSSMVNEHFLTSWHWSNLPFLFLLLALHLSPCQACGWMTYVMWTIDIMSLSVTLCLCLSVCLSLCVSLCLSLSDECKQLKQPFWNKMYYVALTAWTIEGLIWTKQHCQWPTVKP